MAVNLSPVGGVAGQFFDNNGDPLVGGKLFTYAAGTTTPQVTYTSSSGATPNSNPIILNAGGRVPSEIWLTDGLVYKFVLYSSTDQLIGSWDNIIGINSNFVNFVTSEEVQTATAGQTVFTLTTMSYQPGLNNLVVYVDGVNQVEGGSYSFVETNATTVTFTAGLHLGAVVKFVSAETLTTVGSNANVIAYEPAGSGAVTTTVQAKLRETVSVKDFGAVGDGVTDDTAAIQAALDSGASGVYVPEGVYKLSSSINMRSNKTLFGACRFNSVLHLNAGCSIIGDNIGYFTIKNLNIRGSSISDPLSLGIHFYNRTTRFVLDSIVFSGSHKYCFYMESGWVFTLRNILAIEGSCATEGVIWLDGFRTTNGPRGGIPEAINAYAIQNSYLATNAGDTLTPSDFAIKIGGNASGGPGSQGSISDCWIEGGELVGVWAESASSLTIKNCWFEAQKQSCIYFAGFAFCLNISDNHLAASAGTAGSQIQFALTSYIYPTVIENNWFRTATTYTIDYGATGRIGKLTRIVNNLGLSNYNSMRYANSVNLSDAKGLVYTATTVDASQTQVFLIDTVVPGDNALQNVLVSFVAKNTATNAQISGTFAVSCNSSLPISVDSNALTLAGPATTAAMSFVAVPGEGFACRVTSGAVETWEWKVNITNLL